MKIKHYTSFILQSRLLKSRLICYFVEYYYLFLLLNTIIVCYYCKIHFMLIKDFNRFMATKQGIMVRNIFVDSAYNASLAQNC